MRHTLAALRVLVVLPYPPLPEGGAAARCALALLRGLQDQGVTCQALSADIGSASQDDLPIDVASHGDLSVGAPSQDSPVDVALHGDLLVGASSQDLPVDAASHGDLPVGASSQDSPIGMASHGDLPIGIPVETVSLAPPSSWQARRDRLVHPNGLLARGEFAARLQALSSQVDVVHFVEAQAAVGLRLVRSPALAQIHFHTRRDRQIGVPWRRAGRDAIELVRAERQVCRRARWLLANSAEVAAELASSAPHAEVAVAPLALDKRYYTPRAPLDSSAAGLIGTASWPPTAKAVERLLTEVWPRVRERRPRARLLLAGAGMERSTFSHLPDHPGVEWRGRVPSATGFLRELGVLLYPLTAGSGLKVKVLEALALGIPVVTTPDGAEGLGARAGVSVESDDRRIVEATVALLDGIEARRDAGAAAHRTFIEHHTPAIAARPVVDLYERMLA